MKNARFVSMVFPKVESKKRVVRGSRALVGTVRDKCWGLNGKRGNERERERAQTSSVWYARMGDE